MKLRNFFWDWRAVILLTTLFFANIASEAASYKTSRVATGFARPIFVCSPPDDTSRLFVLEQHTGRIEIITVANGQILTDPFLDLSGLTTGNEQGLLGLAFHPNYSANGFFYVNYTTTGGGAAGKT